MEHHRTNDSGPQWEAWQWEAWQWVVNVNDEMRSALADELEEGEVEAWLAYLADPHNAFDQEDRAYSASQIAQLCASRRGLVGQDAWSYDSWTQLGEQEYNERHGEAALAELHAVATQIPDGKRVLNDLMEQVGKEAAANDQARYFWYEDSEGFVYMYWRPGQQEGNR